MVEERFNLIFKGEVKSGYAEDVARSVLESLFQFDDEQIDFFNGQAVILGENMNVTTANSFKQALLNAGVITYLLESNETDLEEENQPRSPKPRRKNLERRARIRSSAILPDRRLATDRRC